MAEAFSAYAGAFSTVFYLRQVLVILAIFILGLVISMSLYGKEGNAVKVVFLSFPLALSVLAIEGFVLLVAGIPYNLPIVVAVYLILTIAIVCFGVKNGVRINELFKEKRVFIGISIVAAVVIACIACAGIAPVSISNDSMYRLHMYPKYIVYFGHLRDQFDTFLTDTALGAATIETLPFLFGYDEGFGLREFLYIDLIMYFVYMTYSRLMKIKNADSQEALASDKKRNINNIIVAVIAGLAFALSSPAFIVGHWAMSNMFFMTFFFFAVVEASELAGRDRSVFSMLPVALLMVASSAMRAEGGIFVLLLVICCMLINIDSRHLSLMVSLPLLVLNGAYAVKIFATYTIDNPYTFLTPGKSVMQAGAFACIIVYGLFIKNRLGGKIMKYMPLIYIVGLLAVNGALFVYNRTLFIADVKVFAQNLTRQSGWGMVTELVVASAMAMILYFAVMKIQGKSTLIDSIDIYYLILTIGFFLVTFAVSFMRGDELSVQVGDSGNRVLLQIIPLIIYTLMLYLVRIYECDRE